MDTWEDTPLSELFTVSTYDDIPFARALVLFAIVFVLDVRVEIFFVLLFNVFTPSDIEFIPFDNEIIPLFNFVEPS